MGRVSREQAELNRERVLATACRLFRQHGAENVSIADIMQEVGLTPGGFYKQFASKEALIDEALELGFAQSLQIWGRISERNEGQPYQGLDALVRYFFRQRPGEPGCPMLGFSPLVSSLPADAHATAIYHDGVHRLFSQFQQEAVQGASQQQPEGLSEQEVMVLFAAMIGAGLMGRTMGQTDWVARVQAAVLEALPAQVSGDAESL
jgi:TetR/AcrR family transcriptional repressor of nem operon